MPRTTFLILALLCICTFLVAQEQPEPVILPDDIGETYQKAEQALLLRDFDKSLKLFKKVLRKYPDFAPALRGIGGSYELLNEYELAAEYYDKALEVNPRFSRALYFECANAHFRSGNYFMALELFQEFDTLRQTDIKAFSYNGMAERMAEEKYYKIVNRNIRACNIAMDSIQFLNVASVQNLGDQINTKGDEYFPFVSNDQKLIFYTGRKNDKSDENLFFSTAPFGVWRIGQQVNNSFNTGFNEGMTTLIRDGRKMIFTACGRTEILGTCDLWQAEVRGEKILDPSPVIGYTNSPSWESQAAISCDGSLLYFASNRDDGEGGADIWVCERLPDGRWAEPRNLGNKINTEGDEEAPFITNDGKVLYFSSTGHLGMGEQDIFFSRKDENGEWGDPVNLGIPVNSSYRELGFFLSADGTTGYFASNRKGGRGGMDIYSFLLSDKLQSDNITFVEGFVKDSILNVPVPNATVYFKNRTAIQTDEDGRFFLCIPAKDTLNILVAEKDYHRFRKEFIIPKWDNKVFHEINILLDPLFRLPVYSGELDTADPEPTTTSTFGFSEEIKHNLFFGFDDASLTPDLKEELLNFLQNTFSGNPVSSVEIIGYADDIGSDSYNLILSEKRAKAVGVFLKENGIRVDKIYIEGRGEQKGGGKPKWQDRRVEVVVRIDEG